MSRLVWDFFGPRSKPTAEHFLIHLRQFLEREGLHGLPCGCESTNHLQSSIWCEVIDTKATELLTRALRPKRVESSATVEIDLQ